MEGLNTKFLFILVGLFLINLSSAGLFDPNSELAFHEEGKNGKYGYYEINDTDFWFFNNKPVKTIELLENEYSVYAAWNIKEIEVFKPTKLFDKTNYLDKEQKKDRKNLLSSELHLFREWETKTRTINNQSCLTYETSENQTQVCSEWDNNSYEEPYEEWGKWKLYNFQTVQEGLYQTKTIVTRNSQGTGAIDWVDENEGYNLDKWEIWWDNDWGKKREVTGLGAEDIQYINISYSAGMKLNFSDIRFLNSTENGELTFSLLRKIDGEYATFKVITGGESSIFFYYANPTATSASNYQAIQGTNVLAHWDFDDGTGTILSDISGNGVNGTLQNMEEGDWVNGDVGLALDFGGTNEYVSIDTDVADVKSVLFRFSPNAIISKSSSTMIIGVFGDQSGGSNQEFLGFASNTGTVTDEIVMTYIGDGGGSRRIAWTGTSTIDTNWHTLSIIQDTTYGYGFKVDEVFRNDTLVENANPTLDGDNMIIACQRGGTLCYEGKISEMIIYGANPNNTIQDNFYNTEESAYSIGAEQENLGVSTILITPEDNSNSTSTFINFNFTSIPNQVNLTNGTLSLWNATDNSLLLTNFTTLSGNESINTSFQNNLSQGVYLWNAETCGEGVSCSSAANNNSFVVHTTPLTLIVHDPKPTIGYHLLGNNLTLNWTILEGNENLTEHVINCTYEYNGSITILNNTLCTQINQTSFLYVLGVDSLVFNVTDEFELVTSTLVEWDVNLTEVSQIYDSQVAEGTPNTITKQLRVPILTIDSVILDYNGTNYTTNIDFDSGNYTISSTVVAPLVDADENITFKLFIIMDGISYLTAETTQLIQLVNFSACTTGDQLLNLFLYDEEEKTALLGTIETNARLVSILTGDTIGSVNLDESNVSSVSICLDPISSVGNFYLDADIVYFSTDYAREFYFIRNAELTETPINISLFDLNLNSSTEFLIRYQGQDLIKVEGAIVQLQRYYISSGGSETVEAPLTSISGTAIVHIDLDTVKYSAIVVKDGVILDVFGDIVFDCENELSGQCTQNLYADVSPYNVIDGATLKDFSYIISDTGDKLVTTFSIPSGSTSSVNIVMVQKDQFGETTSCNRTVTTSSGSLECSYNKTIGDSYLMLEINKDGESQAEKEYFVPESNGIVWGGLNWLFLFGLLISVSLMAISSPEWIVGNAVVVLIIGGSLWMADGLNIVAGLGLIVWILAAAIVLILEMSNKEDR